MFLSQAWAAGARNRITHLDGAWYSAITVPWFLMANAVGEARSWYLLGQGRKRVGERNDLHRARAMTVRTLGPLDMVVTSPCLGFCYSFPCSLSATRYYEGNLSYRLWPTPGFWHVINLGLRGIILWLFSKLFFPYFKRHYILEHFYVHSNIEGKVQKFPLYPLRPTCA